jgi:hypothetical protein
MNDDDLDFLGELRGDLAAAAAREPRRRRMPRAVIAGAAATAAAVATISIVLIARSPEPGRHATAGGKPTSGPAPTVGPTSVPRAGFAGPIPLPVGPQLTAVSDTGHSDVWAVGTLSHRSGRQLPRSLVLHYDGATWTRVDVPNIRWLLDVAVTAPGDVWAIGRSGRALHLSDGRWRVVQLPHVRGGQLSEVSGSSPDDVWIVGSQHGARLPGNSIGSHTLAMHWDGQSWSVVETPNFDHRYNGLSDVLDLAADDVWVVGWAAPRQHFSLHWDGSTWHRVALPASLTRGASGTPGLGVIGGDVWAVDNVGGYGFGGGVHLRWDGASWQESPGPAASNKGTPSAIGGARRDDAWAVGNPNQSDSSIQRYDGERWRYENHVTGSELPFWQLELTDLSVVAADDAWIVGYADDPSRHGAHVSPQQIVVLHWDGGQWRVTPVPGVASLGDS